MCTVRLHIRTYIYVCTIIVTLFYLQRLVSFCGNSPKTAMVEYQLLKTLVHKFKKDPLNAEFFLVRKDNHQVFIVLEALVKLAHSKASSE